MPDRIRVEQMRILFREMPVTQYMSFLAIFVAFGMAYFISSDISFVIWLVVILIFSIIRLTTSLWLLKQDLSDEQVLLWGQRTVLMAFIMGLSWGSFSILSLFIDHPMRVFMIFQPMFVLMGISSLGAIYKRYFFAVLLPVFIIVATTLQFTGIDYFAVIGAFLGLVVMPVFVLFWSKTENATIDAIELQFEKQYLAEELGKKKLEAERANKAKSKFLAAASHDLRQPMHALGLYIDAMSSEKDIGRKEELTQKIKMAVTSLNDLFQSLLEVTKLDAGLLEVNVVDFSVSELFKRLEVRFTPLAAAKNLQFDVGTSELVVKSDPILLERILDNLITNAIRYTTVGKIQLKATGDDQETILIDVIDTGTGIPAVEKANIFEEFYQLDNSADENAKGLGLGLSIVKRLCTLLSHPIDISTTVGQGSVFSVRVPLGDPNKASKNNEHDASSNWQFEDAWIVIIDDEESVRDAMQTLLNSWGCQSFVCAADIAEALAVLNDIPQQPALIIADYRLQGNETGVQAIKLINQHLATTIPSIIVSGDTAAELKQEAKENNFKLLNKPVNAGQLRMVVSHILRRRQRQK